MVIFFLQNIEILIDLRLFTLSIIFGFITLSSTILLFTRKQLDKLFLISGFLYTIFSFLTLLFLFWGLTPEIFLNLIYRSSGINLVIDLQIISFNLIIFIIMNLIIFIIGLIIFIIKYSKLFKNIRRITIGVKIIIFIYLLLSMIYYVNIFRNISQIRFSISEDSSYYYDIHTIIDPNDDTLEMHTGFNLTNNGDVVITNINMIMNIRIVNSTIPYLINHTGEIIGIGSKSISEIKGNTIYSSELVINLNASYIPYFIISNTTLKFETDIYAIIQNNIHIHINMIGYDEFTLFDLIYL